MHGSVRTEFVAHPTLDDIELEGHISFSLSEYNTVTVYRRNRDGRATQILSPNAVQAGHIYIARKLRTGRILLEKAAVCEQDTGHVARGLRSLRNEDPGLREFAERTASSGSPANIHRPEALVHDFTLSVRDFDVFRRAGEHRGWVFFDESYDLDLIETERQDLAASYELSVQQLGSLTEFVQAEGPGLSAPERVGLLARTLSMSKALRKTAKQCLDTLRKIGDASWEEPELQARLVGSRASLKQIKAAAELLADDVDVLSDRVEVLINSVRGEPRLSLQDRLGNLAADFPVMQLVEGVSNKEIQVHVGPLTLYVAEDTFRVEGDIGLLERATKIAVRHQPVTPAAGRFAAVQSRKNHGNARTARTNSAAHET